MELLDLLSQYPSLSVEAKRIAEKVLHSERITEEEGIYLYEKGDLAYLGVLATNIRHAKNGKNVYFQP